MLMSSDEKKAMHRQIVMQKRLRPRVWRLPKEWEIVTLIGQVIQQLDDAQQDF